MDSNATKEAFINACYQGKYFMVKELANNITDFDFEYPLKFGTRVHYKMTPLLALSIIRNPTLETVEIFKFLLSKGLKKLDIISGVNTGAPAIINVIMYNPNNIETVKLLVDAGCDINIYGEHFETPLITAISRNATDLVNYLITAGCDVNFSKSKDGPLTYAMYMGNSIEIMKLLIEAGCNLSEEIYKDAVSKGFREIAILIKEKLDKQIVTTGQTTNIHSLDIEKGVNITINLSRPLLLQLLKQVDEPKLKITINLA